MRIYGNTNAIHMRLPGVNTDENMNVSMQAKRDNGNSMYGRTICAGVCCTRKRVSKSKNRMNGRSMQSSSADVVVRESLAIMANGMDNPIRYITMNAIDRYIIDLANLFS